MTSQRIGPLNKQIFVRERVGIVDESTLPVQQYFDIQKDIYWLLDLIIAY